MKKLTANELAILRVCKHKKTDLFGDAAYRVRNLIDSQAGCKLYEVAIVNVLVEIIRKLSKDEPAN